MTQKNNWLKNCLGYSGKNNYSTEAGNGKAIKEYKETKEIKHDKNSEKITIITHTIPKLDNEGKQSYKDLYQDIQDQKESCDLEKIISANMSFDQIKLAIDNNKELFKSPTPEYSGDFSNFATVEKLQEIKNNANLNGKNYNEFVKNSNKVINKYNDIAKAIAQKQKELAELKKFEQYNKKTGENKK